MSALPLIRISPSEFQFAVSRSGYTSRLRLTCLQQQPVGFKFKTNAPHKFLVKPVVWALTERGAVVDVVVRSTSPVTDDDRFLIQTVALAAEEAVDLDSAKWRTLDPSRIMEDLISCTSEHITSPRRASLSPTKQQQQMPPLVAVSPQVYNFGDYRIMDDVKRHMQQQQQQQHVDNIDASALAKQFYSLMPGMDFNGWSWQEFSLFFVACILLGFLLPAIYSSTLRILTLVVPYSM